jgi:hypothetical protein
MSSKRKAGNGGEGRSDEATHDERVSAIVDLMLQGWPRRKIIQIISTNEKFLWKVTTRQIDNYIRDAKAIIRESATFDREEEIGAAIERYRQLHASSYMIHDYKTCLAVSRELTELLGLKAQSTAPPIVIPEIIINVHPAEKT